MEKKHGHKHGCEKGRKSLMFTIMFIFKKYSGPNVMLRNQNMKDFPYNLVYFFNI